MNIDTLGLSLYRLNVFRKWNISINFPLGVQISSNKTCQKENANEPQANINTNTKIKHSIWDNYEQTIAMIPYGPLRF